MNIETSITHIQEMIPSKYIPNVLVGAINSIPTNAAVDTFLKKLNGKIQISTLMTVNPRVNRVLLISW